MLIGLPRNMDGSSRRGRNQGAGLRRRSSKEGHAACRLKLIDERLSTVQASRQLQESGKNARKQRGQIDSEAACVLLQGYLDSQQKLSAPARPGRMSTPATPEPGLTSVELKRN